MTKASKFQQQVRDTLFFPGPSTSSADGEQERDVKGTEDIQTFRSEVY